MIDSCLCDVLLGNKARKKSWPGNKFLQKTLDYIMARTAPLERRNKLMKIVENFSGAL